MFYRCFYSSCRLQGPKARPDKRSAPYKEIVRENALFLQYYKNQKDVVPTDQWDAFVATLTSDLPTTFRITASRGESARLLSIIKSVCFNDYLTGMADLKTASGEDRPIQPPFALPWYPNEYAWQMLLTRMDIRRSEAFYKLHNFLIAETDAGSISRQEAVSMIPPIVLDVRPHHRVLDMCAAPGSKTVQLIEALHADGAVPSGFVVANDVDNDRCYMLVHQAKRLNSPCFIVTNHDSSALPNIRVTNTTSGAVEALRFDRVLCDVPCSGDGTLRKNPDIWQKWNNAQSANLHGIQYRIAKRGAEVLAIGGRLVYSTCSMNPIENEAVLHRLVRESQGALEIVDASAFVPGLKYLPGLSTWRPASKDIEFYETFDDVPERLHTVIRPQMFPPTADEAAGYHLERCLRILPQLQNSGGFFVAALVKHRKLPWEKEPKEEVAATDETATAADAVEPLVAEGQAEATNAGAGEKRKAESDAKAAAAPWGPQRKRKRVTGFKEDPYVFFGDAEPAWQQIKEFYSLSGEFNARCLLTRSVSDKKRNIYYCSEAVRDLVLLNEDAIKMINTGVKTFVRCDNRNMRCSYRLANEGLPGILHLIGPQRCVSICKTDLIVLLQNNTPTTPPLLETLTPETQAAVEHLTAGSCVLKCIDEELTITLVGWRGTKSLRAYTDTNDTVHMLRLLGADLSKYGELFVWIFGCVRHGK